VWVSVVSLPNGNPPLPFSAQDANTGDYIEIKTEQDAQALFNSWEWDHRAANERRYEFANVAGIGAYIVSSDFQEVINRYFYCEKYKSVPPFEGGYDKQPDWWKMAVNVIDKAIDEATKYMRRKHG
jgi:hypothetical protein